MEIRVAECTIDTSSRQARCRGKLVHLSPKAFELLEVLAGARPGVVSKAELLQKLWPSSVVGKANLPKLVWEIRAALGDRRRQPHLIRTVHRFGYGLASEVVSKAPTTEKAPFCWLVYKEGRVALREGDHLVGRHPNSVVPIDTSTVSRNHARILILGGRAVLTDLGSRNGTYVRGARAKGPVTLRDGDTILLGTLPLTFRVPALSDPTDAVASAD